MNPSINILLAPDSFKECMTAVEACQAMERGILKACPSAKCFHAPMADGGEGTLMAMVGAIGGSLHQIEVLGPLGQPVHAVFGILSDGETGVVEMASASGLHLVPVAERNPMVTTTYGTGQLILAALDHGISKLLIGIGGSATNDGGVGALQALGIQFKDLGGNAIGFGGGELNRIQVIDTSGLDQRLKSISISVATDVTNPLCGEKGASAVFGPQKGATDEMVRQLDENLRHFGLLTQETTGRNVLESVGGGAAGGLGAGLAAYLKGELISGIEWVMATVGLEEKMKAVDQVWTGEGKMDAQSADGKVIQGVAALAKRYGKPVFAFTGSLGEGFDTLYDKGIDAIQCITPKPMTLEEAIVLGTQNLEQSAESCMRLILAIQNRK